MLDPQVVTKLVEQHIADSVDGQVTDLFSKEEWLNPIEDKIVRFTQDTILRKFANSSSMPEIIEAVKKSVEKMFADGYIPGIENFVDSQIIKKATDESISEIVKKSISRLEKDPQWIKNVEGMINQVVVNRVLSAMSTVDVSAVINRRVDERLNKLKDEIVERTTLKGIQNAAGQVELTVLDQHVVVENQFTTKNLEVVDTAVVNNLNITGDVNISGPSWKNVRIEVAKDAVNLLTDAWKDQLIKDLSAEIKTNGINFESVMIDNIPLVADGKLSDAIVSSSIQELGTLKKLKVSGESHIYDTFSVVNKRVGINTPEPEMALGLWDEEVSVVIGKLKNKTGYIGTGRAQNLAIGVNKDAAIEIDSTGLTVVKKLQVGVNRIGYDKQVPGWSGSKGDIVFNNNINNENNVFAWICLGEYKWKSLRSI